MSDQQKQQTGLFRFGFVSAVKRAGSDLNSETSQKTRKLAGRGSSRAGSPQRSNAGVARKTAAKAGVAAGAAAAPAGATEAAAGTTEAAAGAADAPAGTVEVPAGTAEHSFDDSFTFEDAVTL